MVGSRQNIHPNTRSSARSSGEVEEIGRSKCGGADCRASTNGISRFGGGGGGELGENEMEN